MKVLVTGASGFFGSHVAEELARQGVDVRVLLRRTSSRAFLAGFPHEVAIGDVADAGSLPGAVAGVEAVVHAAGLIKARSAAEFDAINARGTANLLAAIGQAAPDLRRFVYVSSLAAHGPSEDGAPRRAEAEPRPLTAYGRSKLAGEEAVRASPISDRAVIVRPSVIYGPRDPALLSFFQAVRWRVAPLLMGGHNRISIVYATPAYIDTLATSVKKTGRCLIAHEATRTCGYGAELSAQIQEECFWSLTAPIERVTGWDTPYPHAQEWEYFPVKQRVLEAIRRITEVA